MHLPLTNLSASTEATLFAGQSIGGPRRPAACLRWRPGGLPSDPSAGHPCSTSQAEATADAHRGAFLFAEGCSPGPARSARLSVALEIILF